MLSPDDSVPSSVLDDALSRARALIAPPRVLALAKSAPPGVSLRRLFSDPKAVDVTITLTDEVMRFNSTRERDARVAQRRDDASTKGFGVVNALGLRAVGELSRVAPRLALGVVHQKIRALTENLILDAAPAAALPPARAPRAAKDCCST